MTIVIAAAVAVLTSAGDVRAQEFAVVGERSWTDADGWNDVHGWGALVAFPFHPHLRARVGLRTSTGTWQRTGRTCVAYAPRGVNCEDEPVSTESTLRGATLALIAGTGSRVWVGLGAGVSFSEVRVDDVSESGRATALVEPSAGQTGWHVLAQTRIRPVAGVPVGVTAEVAWHPITFNGCAREPWNVELHCGETAFTEVRIGLVWIR